MTNTRPPAVADMFYPANPGILAATVDRMLGDTPPALPTQPKALIVPHAGYIYSGATAGRAYAQLAPWRAPGSGCARPAQGAPASLLASPSWSTWRSPEPSCAARPGWSLQGRSTSRRAASGWHSWHSLEERNRS